MTKPERLTALLTTRYPKSLWRWIVSQREAGESLGDTVRRLLTEYRAMDLE